MFTHSTNISNGILTRDERKVNKAKDVQGRISTNGSKLVANQEAKRLVESKMVDIVDYKILRKSGALSK